MENPTNNAEKGMDEGRTNITQMTVFFRKYSVNLPPRPKQKAENRFDVSSSEFNISSKDHNFYYMCGFSSSQNNLMPSCAVCDSTGDKCLQQSSVRRK